MGMWNPGDVALVRYRRLGPVSHAEPTTVIDDTPQLTRLYMRPGTPVKLITMPDGELIPRNISFKLRASLPRTIGETTWTTNHAMMLLRPAEAHSIWLFWSEHEWTFRGWYVNLQRPFRRSPTGFDTADHVLDLFVDPDLTWCWKDEDELVDAVEVGRFTQTEADELYAEGRRVIARLEARSWPFDAGYEDWRPDPGWQIPVMPANWDETE